MKRAIPLLALLAGCGGAPTPQPAPPPLPPLAQPSAAPLIETPAATPDAEFRQKAPESDAKVTFVAPKIEEAKLKNGVRVLIIERHELPIVAFEVVIPIGAGDVPGARPGSLRFLASMLEQGTKKRSALALSDEFQAMGASHDAYCDWDSTGMRVKVLSEKLDAGLELMSDVVLAPTFPADEIERLRTRWIANIQAEKSNPGSVAQNAIGPALFGRAHPYGHALNGEEADAKKFARTEVMSAFARLYAPRHAAIVVAGDVTPSQIVPKLEASFGSWKSGANVADGRAPKAPNKTAASKRIVLVDRPGAQSQIWVARPGAPHATKDRDVIAVLNAIFGGMFSSRINLNLREKNAYTYGARSYFALRHGAGPFQAGAAVHLDKTGPAVRELFAEMDALRNSGPTDDELELAKENLRLAMPSRFETVADVASAAAALVIHDLPLDYYQTLPEHIDAVTAADVKRVANAFLVPDTMTVVVVGTKSVIVPQLEALGLGDYEERDAWGNPVPSVPRVERSADQR